VHGNGALTAVRTSLSEQLATLRGVAVSELPASLLAVAVRQVAGVHVLLPADWEALRHDEGAAGRPVPFWARPWPSGTALAEALSAGPPPAGARVVELGCGLAVPSIVAAQAGAEVLATDGASDAVAYAAHSLALSQTTGEVAHAAWAEHGDELAERGPFDLVLAADVCYTPQNADALVRLLPRLVAPGGEVRMADPGRANARRFLSAARASFTLDSHPAGAVTLYRLRPRPR
jgi:predicted nicotinamide N-methyase